MMRICRLCGLACSSGVHFDLRSLRTGVKASYDICSECFNRRHPLIIPTELHTTGVSQIVMDYETFNDGSKASE